MTDVTEPAVRTESAWKIFSQEAEEVQAVRDVTITINRGEFTALAGPSGSGKTTLLNLIGGLTRPTRGRIWVAGQEVSTMSNQELARLRLAQIGFVFQAYNLLPVLTAMENAEFPMFAPRRRAGGPQVPHRRAVCANWDDGARRPTARQALWRAAAESGGSAGRRQPPSSGVGRRANGQSRHGVKRSVAGCDGRTQSGAWRHLCLRDSRRTRDEAVSSAGADGRRGDSLGRDPVTASRTPTPRFTAILAVCLWAGAVSPAHAQSRLLNGYLQTVPVYTGSTELQPTNVSSFNRFRLSTEPVFGTFSANVAYEHAATFRWRDLVGGFGRRRARRRRVAETSMDTV